MKLSKRLKSVFDYIPQDSVLVDIGTDHGLLIVYALEEKRVTKAYALDIAKQPLEAAKKNTELYNVSKYVSFQLRNGLQGFQDDADCYVIAGMGAETIWDIMSHYDFDSEDTVIIQSNTKLPWLRQTLLSNGYTITDEKFLIDKKIPTFIMKVKKAIVSGFDLNDLWIGPILKQNPNQEYLDYLTERLRHIQQFVDRNPIHKEEINVLKNYL